MWIMTPYGFFSIVNTPAPDTMVIRARSRAHLEALKKAIPHTLPRINARGGTDYPFRITAPRATVLAVVGYMAESIDYGNFKEEAHRVSPGDRQYQDFLREVWTLGHRLGEPVRRHPWRYARPIADKKIKK